MELYESMRQFADSWGLVYMMVIFVAVVLYTFRPWAKDHYEAQAQIPLDEEQDENVQ